MSKIEIDELFVNLFALPEEFVWKNNTQKSSSNNNNNDSLSSSDRSGRRRRRSSSKRQKHRKSKNTIEIQQTQNTPKKDRSFEFGLFSSDVVTMPWFVLCIYFIIYIVYFNFINLLL